MRKHMFSIQGGASVSKGHQEGFRQPVKLAVVVLCPVLESAVLEVLPLLAGERAIFPGLI